MARSPVGNISRYNRRIPRGRERVDEENSSLRTLLQQEGYNQEQLEGLGAVVEGQPGQPQEPAVEGAVPVTEEAPPLEEAPPKTEPTTPAVPWFNAPEQVEAQRNRYLQNENAMAQMGLDPAIAQNPGMFQKFMQQYQQRFSAAMANMQIPANSQAASAMYAQLQAQIGQELSEELLGAAGGGAPAATSALPGTTPDTRAQPPVADTEAGQEQPPPADPGYEEQGKPVVEPPPGEEGAVVDPYQATYDLNDGVEGADYANTYAGLEGFREDNQYVHEYNWYSLVNDAVQNANPNDMQAFKAVWISKLNRNHRRKDGEDQFYFENAWMSFEDLKSATGGVAQRYRQEAMQEKQHQDVFDELRDWARDTQYGKDPSVTPFGDDEGWGDFAKELFGDLGALPDTGQLLRSMLDMYPIDDFSVDAMPNATPAERRAAYLDSLKEQGIDVTEIQAGDSVAQRRFLEDLRDKAMNMLDTDALQEYMNVDDEAYNQIKETGLGFILEQFAATPDAPQLDTAKIEEHLGRIMKPAERQLYRDVQRSVKGHAAAGRGRSGAVGKTVAELSRDFHAAKSATASQMIMDAEKKNADLMARAIENVQKGKMQAIEELGNIRRDDLDAMLTKAGLYGTLVGDTLSFVSDQARLALGEEEVDTERFNIKARQHMQAVELEIDATLKLAGLDLEQYKTDVGVDTDRMKIDLEKWYRKEGMDLQAAQLKADQIANQWEAATAATNMVQRNDQERLLEMAALALKAEQGDREAWGAYQRMMLSEQLEHRGMDIRMADMYVDMAWQKHAMEEGFDFDEWKTRYWAEHEKELEQMGIDSAEDIAEMEMWADMGPDTIAIGGGG